MTRDDIIEILDWHPSHFEHGASGLLSRIERVVAVAVAAEREALERCKQVCAATAEEWRTDAEEWKAQRDALLEALKNIDKEFSKHGRQHWPEAVKARAAIAKVEEKQ